MSTCPILHPQHQSSYSANDTSSYATSSLHGIDHCEVIPLGLLLGEHYTVTNVLLTDLDHWWYWMILQVFRACFLCRKTLLSGSRIRVIVECWLGWLRWVLIASPSRRGLFEWCKGLLDLAGQERFVVFRTLSFLLGWMRSGQGEGERRVWVRWMRSVVCR